MNLLDYISNDLSYKKNSFKISKKYCLNNVIFITEMNQMMNKNNYNDQNEFYKNIIHNKSSYQKLKNCLLNNLVIDDHNQKRIHQDFLTLEKYGLDSFIPYNQMNKKLQQKLNTDELSYLTSNKYQIKGDETSFRAIFNLKSNDSILHPGLIDMLILFNMSKFMAYDVFKDLAQKNYNDVTIYETDSYINQIFLLTSCNLQNKCLNEDKLILICQIADLTVNTLNKLAHLRGQNINKKFDLMLYFSNAEKKFPQKKGEFITSSHVNSAAATMYDIPFVLIYRSEEFIKVLMHEIVHATRFDKLFCQNPSHNLKLNQPFIFQEVIAETFAELLNCILYSKIKNEDFNKVLEKEINHGLVQTAKILNHFSFKDMNDFLKENDDNRKIYQSTAAFEYHILKTALLINYDKFLEIIQNKGSMQDIYNLILKTIQSDEYNKKIKNLITQNKFNDSFRMSIVEIYNIEEFSNNPLLTMHQTGGQVNYKLKYYKYKQKYLEYKNKYK